MRTRRSGRAFNQLQTYKAEIPSLFALQRGAGRSPTALQARIGSLTADREWFMPWRTIDGRGAAPTALPELEVLVEGVFEQRRFLDLLRHFIVFEDDGRRRARQEDRRLPPVPRRQRGGGGDARARLSRATAVRAGVRAGRSTAASRATGASAWSGTRRARARA